MSPYKNMNDSSSPFDELKFPEIDLHQSATEQAKPSPAVRFSPRRWLANLTFDPWHYGWIVGGGLAAAAVLGMGWWLFQQDTPEVVIVESQPSAGDTVFGQEDALPESGGDEGRATVSELMQAFDVTQPGAGADSAGVDRTTAVDDGFDAAAFVDAVPGDVADDVVVKANREVLRIDAPLRTKKTSELFVAVPAEQAPWRQTPVMWLEHIDELIRNQRPHEAGVELVKYTRHYPDYFPRWRTRLQKKVNQLYRHPR